MPYVQRDRGAITGIFARPQPGFAEEFLAPDDADVVAFRNRTPSAPTADQVESRILDNPLLAAIVRRTATIEGKTVRAVLDEIRSEVGSTQ